MKAFCCLCGFESNELVSHLVEHHEMSVEQYQTEYAGAPVLSGELKNYLTGIELPVQKTSQPSHLVPKLDNTYHFPEITEILKNGLEHGDKVLLVGPTGSGKSQLVLQLAAREKKQVIRFNLHGETSVSNLVGQWVVRGKEMLYIEGVLPTAMRMGCWLLLDELDACTPQVAFVLQSVLEEHGTLTLADKDGEVIYPHSDFRIIATSNTNGKGDSSGLYTGTNVLNEAFLDRFGTVITMDYLPFDEEIKVLTEKVPSMDQVIAAGMVSVATDIRKALLEETVLCTFSTRRLVNWARKFVSLGNINKAAEVAILNRLSDDRKIVEEIIQRYFG